MKRIVLCFCLMTMLITACEHKTLWREDTTVYNVLVTYDWSDITDHELPTAMRVFFYPLSGERTEPYVFDFSGNSGGTVQLPEGDYEVVSYNHDTDNILVSGSTQTALVATTQLINGNSRSVNIPDSLLPQGIPLYDSPEWFCRAHEATVHVDASKDTEATRSGSGKAQKVTLTPEWAVYKISYVVNGIKGMRYVNHAEGAVSGMARNLFVTDNTPGSEECAVPFEATVAKEDSVLRGSFFVWGKVPTEEQDFTVVIWGEDKNVHATKDVSSELASLSDNKQHQHEVSITVSLDVTFGPGNGRGIFNPTVDDYHEIHTDIPIK